MIALSSKTYHLQRTDGPNCVKAKGINKAALHDPRQLYYNALYNQEIGAAYNIGFRAVHNTIMTYTQKRKGFSFFYVKRMVCPNSVDTEPLNIVLTPWENYHTKVLSPDKDCLSNDYPCALQKHGKIFTSCTQLYFYEMAMYHSNTDIAYDILKARNVKKINSLARQITVKATWYLDRDEVMRNIVWQKIYNMKHRIISELKASHGLMIIQPGTRFNQHFTCGLSHKMAEITNPSHHPGQDVMGIFWEELQNNQEFMDS